MNVAIMSSNKISLVRLNKEYKDVLKDPSELISVGPYNEDMHHWIATITGPPDTPYEGGVFHVDIRFPDDYPFHPPKVKFTTRIYHPNISRDGDICLNTLRDNWNASLTISKVLLSICSLLNDPNPNDPLEPTAANLYKRNRQQYNETVKQWTRQYAS